MSSSKAILRQISERNLDPKKAYHKSDMGSDGHFKKSVTVSLVEPKTEDVNLVSNEEMQKEILKKPIETEVDLVSTVSSVSKSNKSIKSALVKTVVEVNKAKASTVPSLPGDKTSDENIVESKKITVSEVAPSVRADESTKLL